jgi:hypothetical protein
MVDGVIEEDRGGPPKALPAPHLLRANLRTGNGHHDESGAPGDSTWSGDSAEPIGAGPGDSGSAVATRPQIRSRKRGVATATGEVAALERVTDAPTRPVRLSLGGRMSAMMPATLRTAFGALRRNLMRSALTTLGIIIGVGAVIAMVEISTGSRTALMKTMASMGANVLIVANGAAASGGVSWGSGTEETLTPDDAIEMARQCPAVADVAPIVSAGGQVVYGNRNWVPMNVTGTTPGYLVVRDWNNMDEGEMFTERDVLASNRVCVIGRTLARELFQGESPVGKDIRIKNVSLRVVGVLGAKGPT